MKYISLFSGIGGFELGIQKAYKDFAKTEAVLKGTHFYKEPECIGFSEIDKFAIQVYKKHFPDHVNFGDITNVDAKDLPDFDLLLAGFPCPTFSIAGARKGFDDQRGELIFDVIRVLKEKQPKTFLLENVKGLISHDQGRTMEIICEGLCEAGYVIDFEVLNSKFFGVAQNRERVFIVGKRLDILPEDMII